ncbi:MAG: LptF/LptG family permease [Syntrophobacterales bacterium]|nr:LptF/LptG family permease [Syntrophobacterales bacterium]
MKLIHLYILRLFSLSLFITVFATISLFMAVDFSEKLDDLMAASIPTGEAIEYFVLRIPSIIKEIILPVSVLATLITYGIMSKRLEIVALHASGIPPKRYSIVFVWAGVALSFLYIFFTDTIERPAKIKTSKIWGERVKKVVSIDTTARQIKRGEIWFATKQAIYHIGYYDPQTKTFHRVSISIVNDEFRLQQRIEAKQMAWEDNRWVAKDVTILDTGKGVGLRKISSLPLDTLESPLDFSYFQTSTSELSIRTIFYIIKLMRKEGLNSRSYLLELHLRFAHAASIAISILLTVAIISRRAGILFQSEFKRGLQAFFGFALFFGLFQLGTALASSGVTIASLWGGHLLALIIALILLR